MLVNRWRTAQAVLVLGMALLLLLSVHRPARAETRSPYYCMSGNNCKYGATAMWWDVYSVGHIVYREIEQMRYRGGTASGSCDPTNNIDRWRSQFSGVFNTSGVQTWGIGPTPYYYNCDPHYSGVIVRYPSLARQYDLKALYYFKHVSDTAASSTFTTNECWTVTSPGGANPPRFAQVFT
jgi:hypothetical protein